MASSVRLPWWEAEDTVQKFQRNIAEAQDQLQNLPKAAMAELEARAFATTVMVSCEAERMPAGILPLEEAFRSLTRLYTEILHLYPPAPDGRELSDRRFLFQCQHDWPWQRFFIAGSFHGVKAACLSQMEQHLKALMFLCIYHKGRPLSVPLLKCTHAILMKGCHEDSKLNGCFRDFGVTIHGAAVMHESVIASSFKDMLRRLQGDDEIPALFVSHQHCSHEYFAFPERCARLVHDMTHSRPFASGNEWMCRLIMAFFMVTHDRFAFPVPIAPLTVRSSEEFLHALFAPDDGSLQLHEDSAAGFRREKALLSAYILECTWESLEEVMCSYNPQNC